MKIPKKFLFLLAVASGICWGTYGTFATLMKNYGISEGTISMIVPLFYSIFFFVLLIKDDIRKLKVTGKILLLLIFFGLQSAVFNFAIVKAYLYLPIGIVSTIVFCNLFLLMIFSRLLFHDRITWQKGVAALLAVIGIALVLNVFSLEWSWSMMGLVWTGLSLLTWATVITTEKYLLEKQVDSNALMVYNGFFAFLFLCFYTVPWQVIANIGAAVVVSNGIVLLPMAGFALFTSVLSYFFYIVALKRMEPSLVQLGFVMDPLTASILGFFIFDQALLPVQVVGIGLILAVVIWVEWLEVKAARNAAAKVETEAIKKTEATETIEIIAE